MVPYGPIYDIYVYVGFTWVSPKCVTGSATGARETGALDGPAPMEASHIGSSEGFTEWPKWKARLEGLYMAILLYESVQNVQVISSENE